MACHAVCVAWGKAGVSKAVLTLLASAGTHTADSVTPAPATVPATVPAAATATATHTEMHCQWLPLCPAT